MRQGNRSLEYVGHDFLRNVNGIHNVKLQNTYLDYSVYENEFALHILHIVAVFNLIWQDLILS